jgi:hypothetical protein
MNEPLDVFSGAFYCLSVEHLHLTSPSKPSRAFYLDHYLSHDQPTKTKTLSIVYATIEQKLNILISPYFFCKGYWSRYDALC